VTSRKVCVVTGSRAEYGLLYWLLRAIDACPDLTLQLAVTGMHLSPEFGLTYKVIEEDGFRIDARIEMPLSSDTPSDMAKSLGLAVTGFADALARLRPDLLVVLGDRYEILAAVLPAMLARIPIAHLHGGEATEGAIDEAVRHAVTKMAQLHFVAADEYRRRVIQLGEQPDRVFVVGGLGIDNIRHLTLLDRAQLERALDFRLGARNLLVTFHPATLEENAARGQFAELLAALAELSDTHIIFTLPNAESESRVISGMIEDYVNAHPATCKAFTSLGQLRYLSALKLCDGVVGNSSSGLIEAPSLQRGTINIGDRQRGRLRAASVIDCEPRLAAIRAALQRLFSAPFQAGLAQVSNPYGTGGASERIVSTLRTVSLDGILKKRFYDLPAAGAPA
jgi:GDP/UDP-N,N'-diacetylbacillosamine 2-epimerase (hydrolysing)